MIPSGNVTVDDQGVTVILVSQDHLRDFPAFIRFILEKEYGREDGGLKLRMHPDDKQNGRLLKESMVLMKETFKKTMPRKKRKKCHPVQYEYVPDEQVFLKCDDKMFQYCVASTNEAKRKHFVQKALNPECYNQANPSCCDTALESGGADGLLDHYFGVLTSLSEPIERSSKLSMAELVERGRTVTYGAGIIVKETDTLNICKDFSLLNLNTVLDLIGQKVEGINLPFLYVGMEEHSSFPWHIEDGALWSIGYNVAGKRKCWFVVPPTYFGYMDFLLSQAPFQSCDRHCRGFLVNHKSSFADPRKFGIPWKMFLQEPDEFVVLYPFSLHAGLNMGHNVCVAVNFADPGLWAEQARYLVKCGCFPAEEVHLDYATIIQKCRPDLYVNLMKDPYAVYPPEHPRNIIRMSVPSALKKKDCRPTLRCPAKDCARSYAGGKRRLLLHHISTAHQEMQEKLVIRFNELYPQVFKTEAGFTCRVCDQFMRQSITHLTTHHKRKHPDVIYEGPKERQN